MALEGYADYTVARVAGGYISQFGGMLFNVVQTLPGFGTVTSRTVSLALPSATVQDGIMTLAGGRVYSPWSQVDRRAPVTYPRYTQTIAYSGDADACIRRYTDLLYYAGLTKPLYFTYGRRFYDGTNSDTYHNYEHYGAKNCPAMLISVMSTMDHDLQTRRTPRSKTYFVVTAIWQQVGDFVLT